MGKYMRKCKVSSEVTVMGEVSNYVGVKTRARTLAMAIARETKRSKVVRRESEFCSSYDQSQNSERLLIKPELMVYPATSSSDNSGNGGGCVSSSDRCSRSNRSCDFVSGDSVKRSVVDLEREEDFKFENSTQKFHTRESDLGSESNDLESTTRQSEADSRSSLTAEKMPSEAEIEDFFSAFEKDEQKHFAEKYNYDIVKDIPLEGRYEWISLKP